MSKASKILNGIFKGIAFLVFVNIALLCMAIAYIMFAPNDYPKPFLLVYSTPNAEQENILSGILDPERGGPTSTPFPIPTVVTMPGQGVMVDMSTKIVNLADTTGRRYIRLTVVLEFAKNSPIFVTTEESTEEAEAVNPDDVLKSEISALTPLMDDVVITLLSTKSYEELYTADGKETLRTEIMDAINEKLSDYKVISVYFTEFVVQ